MNERQPKETELLRQWLQEGDPAAGGPPLGSSEVTRIRNRILAEQTAPAPRKFGIWAFAGTMAAAALVLGLVLWPRQANHSGIPPVAVPPPPEISQAVPPSIAAAPRPTVPVVEHGAAGPKPTPAPRQPAAPEPVEARTLLFEGPQGTQIIWVVNDRI